MEKLLNKLIDMGWKPRGVDSDKIIYLSIIKEIRLDEYDDAFYFSINDLRSIDSGLRQFVVANKLYCNKQIFNSKEEYSYRIVGINVSSDYNPCDINYRLMLSSIQPDKEKFILDNIKTEG